MYFNTALFIVGLVIVGYTFSSRLFWLKYRLRLTQGYHTFLFTAGWSIIPIGVSLGFMATPPGEWVTNGFEKAFQNAFPVQIDEISPYLLSLVTYSLITALIIPWLIHWLIRATLNIDTATLKIYAMYTAEPAPVMTNLLFDSYAKGLPIAFTLSDRKVYLGYPTFISSSMFSPHGSDIHITPLESGYREEETLNLHLDTPYDVVLDEILSGTENTRSSDEFVITIPTREIVHAHLYDRSLTETFVRHAENHTSS